jgi:hypothetical protein
MTINLSSYQTLRTALFVRIAVDEYRTSSSGSFTSQILRFSDHNTAFTINGESYVPVGNLLGITSSTSELRSTGNTITITLSGIPTNSLGEIINSKIKGSEVKIYRGYFDNAGVQIGTTQERFFGSVNNYNLDEDYDVLSRTATNTIQIECLSNIQILQTKQSGRKTNPESMKRFYPNDISFDRVPSLIASQFDFGGKR